jgi:hypothetical protein
MIDTKPMTQKQRVWELLSLWGSMCVSDVPDALAYTLRNRISELRREGKAIRSAPCGWHKHAHPVSRYTLVKPEQQEIKL